MGVTLRQHVTQSGDQDQTRSLRTATLLAVLVAFGEGFLACGNEEVGRRALLAVDCRLAENQARHNRALREVEENGE